MRGLRDRQHAGGAKQLLDVIERLAQVLGGVQPAGGDDQVERVEIEALLERTAREIERPELREGILREFVLGIGGEPLRRVGEQVFGAMLRQHGENEAGRRTSSAADLQDPQGPPALAAAERVR